MAMVDNKVRTYGKFQYIEPNDLSQGENDVASWGRTPSYENFHISVELEVNVPNRGVWTSNLMSNKTTSSRNSTSFFWGDNGYLNDNPGSFIYTDLLTGKQNQESLGINHIHVTYNSYHYPEVTINFTDIRGMGLMMPHEESYRQEILEKNGIELDGDTKRVEKLFAALFTFPYPEFKLRIKGFYGKKVEYSLVVSDFKSRFNNQTGNFEATVQFIGKMYGVYTDIPMTYLIAAPYCKYHSNDDKTIWEVKKPQLDGEPMLTFLQIKEKIAKSNDVITDVVPQSIHERLNQLYAKRLIIENIDAAFSNLCLHLKNNHYSDIETINGKDHVFLFKDKDIKNKLYPSENCTLTILSQKLYDLINEANSDYKLGLPFVYPLNSRIKHIGEEDKYDIVFENDKWSFTHSEEDMPKSITEADLPKTNHGVKYYLVDGGALINKLINVKADIDSKIQLELPVFNEIMSKKYQEILSFNPTIKNIFTILMTHLEMFIDLMCTCVSNINSDTTRTLNKLGISEKNLPDIPTSQIGNKQIPPFPAFKNTLNNKFCYPTDLGVTDLEEDILIKSMFSGINNAKNTLDDIGEYESENSDIRNLFIPTCISDFNCINFGNPNPYYHAFKNNAETASVEWIYTFFALRSIQKFIIEQHNDLTPEEFGAYEAYNFWLAHPSLSENVKNILTKGIGKNFGTYKKFITGESDFNEISHTPCYCQIGKKNSLLTNTNISGEDFLTLPENEDTPIGVGYDNDYITFLYSHLNNNGYSIKNGKTDVGTMSQKRVTVIDGGFLNTDKTVSYKFPIKNIPFKFINDITLRNMTEWQNKISNINKLPSDKYDKHSNIIKKFYDPEISVDYYQSSKNILFDSDKTGLFFNKITEFYIKDKYPSIKECSVLSNKEERGNVLLHSIQTENEHPSYPLFLNENLTPEDFLIVIPHNIERIVNSIKNNYGIITIPYVTKLYIGYLIDIVTKSDDLYVIENLYNSISKLTLGFEDVRNAKYESIYKIISLLTSNEKDEFHDIFGKDGWNEVDGYGEYLGRIGELKGENTAKMCVLKSNGFLKKDIFGFAKEYQEWSQSKERNFKTFYRENGEYVEIPGFLWIKNKMCLKERYINKDDTFVYGFNTEYNQFYPEGKTPTERLVWLLKNDVISNALFTLNGKGENSSLSARDKTNPLNKYYYHYNDNENSNGTAFGDIYSGIYLYEANSGSKVWLRFNPEYEGTQALDKMFRENTYLINPFPATYYKNDEYGVLKGETSKFNSAFNSFITTLENLYNPVKSNEGTNNNSALNIDNDHYLSMYQTLKLLYDKHFSNIESERDVYRAQYNDKNTELGRFHFIDTYYKNISNELMINPNILNDLITTAIGEYNTKDDGIMGNMNLYSFMSSICEKHNMLLLAMPIFNGPIHDEVGKDNFTKMFKVLSPKEADTTPLHGPSYVCFYPHKPSQHLDIPTSHYENDGFIITEDINDTKNFDGPSSITDLMSSDDYVIPSFGVEYGTQKQSIFTNINVNMDNPQVTEASAANLFAIANTANTNPNSVYFSGQNLYKIYSNYSYTCQVEMMGCAQIQPLMYFQLNNIPMFRGAYQIIQVEHDITPGNMKTSFRGVRINKTNIPLANSIMNFNMGDIMDQARSGKITFNAKPFTPTDMGDERNVSEHSQCTYTANDFEQNKSSYIKFNDETVKRGFNRLNPTLRAVIWSLTDDLKDMSEKLGYTIGLWVTSTTRNTNIGNSKSHHLIGSTCSSDVPRKNTYGVKLDENGTKVSDDASYCEMGCAIDMQVTCNGNIMEGHNKKSALQVFHHIALNYTKYIKQLIWEIGVDDIVSNEKINVIHLASLGEASNTNRGAIFMARLIKNSDNKITTKTVRDKTRQIFPDAFNDICSELEKRSDICIDFYSYQ